MKKTVLVIVLVLLPLTGNATVQAPEAPNYERLYMEYAILGVNGMLLATNATALSKQGSVMWGTLGILASGVSVVAAQSNAAEASTALVVMGGITASVSLLSLRIAIDHGRATSKKPRDELTIAPFVSGRTAGVMLKLDL